MSRDAAGEIGGVEEWMRTPARVRLPLSVFSTLLIIPPPSALTVH